MKPRKYSIILPVRNGGDYVKECVGNILSQTHADFELVVLENASTDDTFQWISSLEDKRVKIFPSDKPLSIEENWGRIVTVPKNEYMTIIGHDDILSEEYLQIMNDLIRKHPGASLYQSHFRYIDSQGKEIRKCLHMEEAQQPATVVKNFISSRMDIMGTGFMMRSRDFDSVGGIPAYANLLFADMELFIELAKKSYLAVESRECFAYRSHPGATTSVSTDTKILQAFDQFVRYLIKLKETDLTFAAVIRENADHLLQQYCQGITHKILRTPLSKRQTPGVSAIIDQFREYGKRLKDNNEFEPMNSIVIRTGKWIDSNVLSRSLFLLFKKVYRKPVL